MLFTESTRFFFKVNNYDDEGEWSNQNRGRQSSKGTGIGVELRNTFTDITGIKWHTNKAIDKSKITLCYY